MLLQDQIKFTVAPSRPDLRDKNYTKQNVPIAREIDLRQWDSLVESQGQLGSCVGNAITNAYELLVKQKRPTDFIDLSRLFVYYNARVIEETVNEDYGVVYMRNALKGCNHYGLCTELLWPYDESKFAEKPSEEAYNDGLKRPIISYATVNGITNMLEVLNLGYPIVIGMETYEGFMELDQTNSVISMPELDSEMLGGHAMTIVGYSLPHQQFLVKNSFGEDWGADGYCWMPFDYVKKYVFERWVFEI